MTAIIAYGTVVRTPLVIGLPLPGEERSVGFSVVIEEDFPDDSGGALKRGLYRVILAGDQAHYALHNVKIGSPVLVRGDLISHYTSMGDPTWNHRVLFGEEVLLLSGELPNGRAYTIQGSDEFVPLRALG